jgi:integrase
MKANLSARFLKTAEAQPGSALDNHGRPKPFEVYDETLSGLILRVQPTGRRYYYFEYARHKRLPLGNVEHLDADEARNMAKTIAGNVAAGRAPDSGLRPQATQTLAAFIAGDFTSYVRAHRPRSLEPTLARLKAAGFDKFMADDLTALTEDRFERYKTERLAAGKKPATVIRDLAALSGVLGRAKKLRIIASNPLLSVDKPKKDKGKRPRFLTPDEATRLRNALTARDTKVHPGPYKDELTPAVLLSVNTGMRRGELMALRWRDVDIARRELVIHGITAKSGQSRPIPLNDEAAAALRAWRKQSKGRSEARVFTVLTSYKTAWRKLMKDARISKFRWHDLRHTFASHLVQRDVNLNTVRDLLGHKDLTTTLKYAEIADTNRRDAVDSLNK